MYYTIKSAIRSKLFDKIVASSDSKKNSNLSKKLGAVIFSRPKKLSRNNIPKLNAIKHAVLNQNIMKKFDYVFDLDVTAPCRDAKILSSF